MYLLVALLLVSKHAITSASTDVSVNVNTAFIIPSLKPKGAANHHLRTKSKTATSATSINLDDQPKYPKPQILDSNKIFASQRIAIPRLTIILPAYNEEKRIYNTIQRYRTFLEQSSIWARDGGRWSDILIVDDGSTDQTCAVVANITVSASGIASTEDGATNIEEEEKGGIHVNCISLSQNEGKGSAIAKGMQHVSQKHREMKQQLEERKIQSNHNTADYDWKEDSIGAGGWIVLVADADGSGDIECLDAMLSVLIETLHQPSKKENNIDSNFKAATNSKFIWDRPGIVVGNRGYEGISSLKRTITRWGFRTAVKLICGDLGVQDSQCGFKLMTVSAGRCLYKDLNLKRWTHDVEVLYRAKNMGINVMEARVDWVDMEGSKLIADGCDDISKGEYFGGGTIVGVSAAMLLEILQMRIEYLIGRWRIIPYND